MKKNVKIFSAVITGLLIFLVLFGKAQSRTSEENSADTVRQVRAVSKRLNVPEFTVQELLKRNLDWNEVIPLLVIARKSGQNLDLLWAQKQSGMPWKKIAEKYHLDYGDIEKQIKLAKQDLKRSTGSKPKSSALQKAPDPLSSPGGSSYTP